MTQQINYMAHTERTIPPDDLLRLIESKDRTGHFEMALAYVDSDGEVIEYSFQLPTKITDSIRPGGKDFGWDSIISLGDDPRALSEYPQEDRYGLFTRNFELLTKDLRKK
jgi:inosine/xanthosine triphosphate pyrophosphatase family protein